MSDSRQVIETEREKGPADLSVAASARAVCKELVEQAVGLLGGRGGALYALVNVKALQVLAVSADDSTWAGDELQQAALSALTARQPALSVPERDGPHGGPAERYVAVPLELAGEMLGVVMVGGVPPAQHSAQVELGRLGQVPQMLALSLDRFRLLSAIDQRGQEVDALSQQLEAFAVDFRATYQAERDRSSQLGEALAELARTYKATVGALAMAVEAKDECTGGHLYRVSRYGMLLTSLVAPEHADDPQFEYGFLLHDVGKLMVPDLVLNKPGALTDDEWEVMRAHPARGRSILEGIAFLDVAREIVYCHHERWDGKGYPRGLAGIEIPLGARLFPLCDAFDAMTSDRPYRSAMPAAAALEQVRAGAGTQFWSEAVDAFLGIPVDELEAVIGQRREHFEQTKLVP